LNPVDKCVANKVIKGKQCTLGWYINDNILSHADHYVVDSVLAIVEKRFPGLVIERGKSLNFLGMELEFYDKKVKIGTVQYIKNMITSLEEELRTTLKSKHTNPATSSLFKTNKEAKPINEKKADISKQYIPMVLWIMKRSRPDVKPTVSFLMKRVANPDQDDWHKFMQMMCWLKNTQEDVQIVSANTLTDMLTMVDSAHAVHENMRGHTGGLINFGTGVVDQKASTQKMNTKSSTKTKQVRTSEYFPKNIYFEMFMNGQGYNL
jgi:hypothetical protein